MKVLPTLAAILGLLFSTIAAAQQVAGELPDLSYKYDKQEIPKHILLHQFLFTLPAYFEQKETSDLLLQKINLEDPRAASILRAAADRYLDIVTGGHPLIVRDIQEDDGSTSVLKYGDSSAPKPVELAGLEGAALTQASHELELDRVRHLAEIYASLAQDLRTIGLDTRGIDTYLDKELRPNTTMVSDKPFREGSSAWEIAQTFELHLATQER